MNSHTFLLIIAFVAGNVQLSVSLPDNATLKTAANSDISITPLAKSAIHASQADAHTETQTELEAVGIPKVLCALIASYCIEPENAPIQGNTSGPSPIMWDNLWNGCPPR